MDGFEDDRFGVIYKTHHALADGISAVDIGTLLFDLEPNAEPVREVAPWNPKTPPSQARLAGHAVQRSGGDPCSRLPLAAGARSQPPAGGEADRRRGRRPLGGRLGADQARAEDAVQRRHQPQPVLLLGLRAASTSSSRSRTRSAGPSTTSPSPSRRAPCATGSTIARTQTDGVELQALVPVSVRAEDEHGELGNRLTAMRGPLPVGIADPAERLRFVSSAMDDLKASKQPLGGGGDLDPQRLVPGFRAAGPAGADRGDQLLDPPLQPPGHQLPRAADPALRARQGAARGLPGRVPGQAPCPGDGDHQLQRLDQLRPGRRSRGGRRRGADRGVSRRRRRRAARGRPRRRRPREGAPQAA